MLNPTEHSTFADTYERLRSLCIRIAYRITNDAGLAEDVVHSAFEKIMAHKDKFFTLPDEKRDAYIVAMVKNKAIDSLRSKHNNDVVWDEANEKDWQLSTLSDVEKTYEDKEGYTYICALIKELPPLYRVVFEMRYIAGYTNEEIANALDIEKSAVSTQLVRAREKMRKKISKKYLILLAAALLTVSALLFNDDVRAATVGRLANWLRFTVLQFQGEGIDESIRHYFWQPAYVPSELTLITNEHYLDDDKGAFTFMFFASDHLHVMFSAHWMFYAQDGTGGGRGIPAEGATHQIYAQNGIEYHLIIAQTEDAARMLGNLPVSIFWEYRGFTFQMQGTNDPETLLKMAVSVAPVF
ncbi:MAG: sigma-70 family RNA polymerase sigma factor [Defluviitaleaceae bacterium]|nr:sigma-70 family RNA polymerase sigma factor [Defluviitaleaceae bacterium]MCL2274751.1 sigma-70 family RNA polymerase sigma factor [Defluviitaleaceae bacterium]